MRTTFSKYLLSSNTTFEIVITIEIRRCGMSANETTLHPSHNALEVNINHTSSKYGTQPGVLAHIEHQAIKGHTMTSIT